MCTGSKWRLGTTIAVAVGLFAIGERGHAADYYAGKSVDIVVGGAAGGGIDLYTRLISRHLARHIPGTPTIVVRNLPGASGTRAVQHVAMAAPPNGLTIAATAPGAIVGPLLDGKAGDPSDPSKLVYLGTSNVGVSICATMRTSKIRSFEDFRTHKAVLGSQGPGAPSYDIAYLVKRTTGAAFDIVGGYNGSTHIVLAMERGEVDGVCGWNWSGVRSQRPGWIRDKVLNIVAQVGIKEDAELALMNVPTIWRFIADPELRKIAEFVLMQKGFERPLLVRGGTPPQIVDILRKAFDATMADAQFLADAEKASLEISPSPGAKVQELVQAFYATPADIIEKARLAIRP